MTDHDFGHQAAADPLPDRLKQYLTEMARRELDTLRADLEEKLVALETALARPEQHDSLETLVFDLARAATVEAEAAASRAMLDAQIRVQERSGTTEALRDLEVERNTVKALRVEIEELRGRLGADLAVLRDEHDDVSEQLAAAQRDLAAAQRDLEAARTEVTDARRVAEARAAEVAVARESAGASQVEAAARAKALEEKLKTAEAERANAERVRREAVNRAETAEVLARETLARVSNAEAWSKDLEKRLKEAEARAAREESRLRDAETRAEAAVSARESIVAEMEALRQAVARERDAASKHTDETAALQSKLEENERRLAAADERIRALELQLFQRARGESDRDQELSDMLTTLPSGPIRGTRRASRYSFGGKVNIEVDGRAAVLVDLSTGGAQILSAVPLDKGSELDVRLLSDEIPATCRGRVVWTRLEAKAPRYRAGVAFTQVDVGAVEAFIIRYAAT